MRKNPGVAVVLSLVLLGAGQVYNGHIGKAFLCWLFGFMGVVFTLSGISQMSTYRDAESLIMLLQASQITKRFGHRIVLNGLDLNVQPGEVVTIFGPNGAGKTTLIQIFSTLIKPTSGALQIGGIDALTETLRVRPSLGLVIHEPLAYLELSPYENLKFFGRLYNLDRLEQRIADLLDEVQLTPYAHEPVKIFSRGMVQRFMIAKALIHDPTLLLFDEPFSGLDLAARQFVLKRIDQERARGKGIVLTTHNTELGYHTGSRFHFLLNGQIETVAKKEDIGLEALSREYEDRLKR